jgi:hypothetical protein
MSILEQNNQEPLNTTLECLEKIDDLLTLTDPAEMDNKIFKNTQIITKHLKSFSSKLYEHFDLTQNEIDTLIYCLKFIDTLNLFMNNHTIDFLLKITCEIHDLVCFISNFNSRGEIIKRVKYTEKSIIFYKKKIYKNLFFTDSDTLGSEIEKCLEAIYQNGVIDHKIFKQMQNIFYVVQNKIDEPFRETLQNKFNDLKLLNIKNRKQKFNFFQEDYADYKNYNEYKDYNDNYNYEYNYTNYDNSNSTLGTSYSGYGYNKSSYGTGYQKSYSMGGNRYYAPKQYEYNDVTPSSYNNLGSDDMEFKNIEGSAIEIQDTCEIKVEDKCDQINRGNEQNVPSSSVNVQLMSNNNNSEKTNPDENTQASANTGGAHNDFTYEVRKNEYNYKAHSYNKSGYNNYTSGYGYNNSYNNNYNNNYNNAYKNSYNKDKAYTTIIKDYEPEIKPLTNTQQVATDIKDPNNSIEIITVNNKQDTITTAVNQENTLEVLENKPKNVQNYYNENFYKNYVYYYEKSAGNKTDQQNKKAPNNTNNNTKKRHSSSNTNNNNYYYRVIETVLPDTPTPVANNNIGFTQIITTKEETTNAQVYQANLKEEQKQEPTIASNTCVTEEKQKYPLDKDIETIQTVVKEDYNKSYTPNATYTQTNYYSYKNKNNNYYNATNSNYYQKNSYYYNNNNPSYQNPHNNYINNNSSSIKSYKSEEDTSNANTTPNNNVYSNKRVHHTASNNRHAPKNQIRHEFVDLADSNFQINKKPESGVENLVVTNFKANVQVNQDDKAKELNNDKPKTESLQQVVTKSPEKHINIDIEEMFAPNKANKKELFLANNEESSSSDIVDYDDEEEPEDNDESSDSIDPEIIEAEFENFKKMNEMQYHDYRDNDKELETKNNKVIFEDEVKVVQVAEEEPTENKENLKEEGQTQFRWRAIDFQTSLEDIDPQKLIEIKNKLNEDDKKLNREDLKANTYYINNKIPIQNYLFSNYAHFFYRGRDSNIHREYFALKCLEAENPSLINRNLENFEDKILIPIYQKINYNVNKKKGVYFYTFNKYKKLIYRVLGKDKILQKVKPYGSYMNNFLIDSGDIDICIVPKCGILEFSNHLDKIKEEIMQSVSIYFNI